MRHAPPLWGQGWRKEGAHNFKIGFLQSNFKTCISYPFLRNQPAVYKKRDNDLDFLIEVAVHDLAFPLLVTLSHVANKVGELRFGAIDFKLTSPAGLNRASSFQWSRR